MPAGFAIQKPGNARPVACTATLHAWPLAWHAKAVGPVKARAIYPVLLSLYFVRRMGAISLYCVSVNPSLHQSREKLYQTASTGRSFENGAICAHSSTCTVEKAHKHYTLPTPSHRRQVPKIGKMNKTEKPKFGTFHDWKVFACIA